MRPRDLPASFVKATRTYWTGRRQPTRTVAREASVNFTGCCPIREHTADGHYVGRCWFATYDDICPRHGVLEQYPDNDDRAVLAHKRQRTR